MVTYDISIDGSHAPMPSDYYEDLTLPQGGGYTAPADGWLMASGRSNEASGGVLGWTVPPDGTESVIIAEGNLWRSIDTDSTTIGLDSYIPVSKGKKVFLYSHNCSIYILRFFYANGSVPTNP